MFSWFSSIRYEGGIIRQFYIVLMAIIASGCKDEPELIISQQANLDNFVNINYSATLMNVKEATRTILWNGDPFETKIITTSNYSETFLNMEKGEYRFILEVESVESNTISLNVPNYNPDANQILLDSLQTNIEYGSQIILNLEGIFTDKNPEDNPVPIQNARSLDEETDVSLDGYNLTINANSISGVYQVEVGFGSNAGGLAKKVISGNISIPVKTLIGEITYMGSPSIYSAKIVDVEGEGIKLKEIKRLTNDQDFKPSYSPDGSKIVFGSSRIVVEGGNIAIYTMNSDGSNQKKLTPNLQQAQYASWGNNDKIYFSYINSDLIGVAEINPDGTGYKRLVEEKLSGRIIGEPELSSDGNKIVFTTFRDGNWEIYTANIDGSNQRNITNSPSREQLPSWFPNSSEIVFRSDIDDPGNPWGTNIYKMDSLGNNLERLTNLLGEESDPSVSPDGEYLLFTNSSLTTSQQIYLMKIDGTEEPIQLTFDGVNRYGSWKPN